MYHRFEIHFLQIADNVSDNIDLFFTSRCNKVLPLAEAAYQENLPTHYVTNFHLSKVNFILFVIFFLND